MGQEILSNIELYYSPEENITNDEIIIADDSVKNADSYIFDKILNRCNKLIEMYPEKSQIFLDYIIQQQQQNDVLENKVICSTMVIR